MTSWLTFIFHSAPWFWRILWSLFFPFLAFRSARVWQYSNGWTLGYKNRPAIGVKPPRLIQESRSELGKMLFVKADSTEEKLQDITCHELTHAFTAHLKLPMWLNEGLAVLTVDHLLGKTTIQTQSLELLRQRNNAESAIGYGQFSVKDREAAVYHFVRGYWLTRYLFETKSELLAELLARRYRHKEIEEKVAQAHRMLPQEFWQKIDTILVEHFRGIAEGEHF